MAREERSLRVYDTERAIAESRLTPYVVTAHRNIRIRSPLDSFANVRLSPRASPLDADPPSASSGYETT